jgi:hypothetical protein
MAKRRAMAKMAQKMASEAEADQARRQHGGDLMRRGAHAIGVEDGRGYGKSGWVVVAHVAPKAKVDLPATLPCAGAQGQVDVPVVPVRSEPFQLE